MSFFEVLRIYWFPSLKSCAALVLCFTVDMTLLGRAQYIFNEKTIINGLHSGFDLICFYIVYGPKLI